MELRTGVLTVCSRLVATRCTWQERLAGMPVKHHKYQYYYCELQLSLGCPAVLVNEHSVQDEMEGC